MTRVPISPDMLRWACERSGRDVVDLASRVSQLPSWLEGERRPTLKQLEKFAAATRTPFGYLFLSAPPEERLPVPDFRTVWGVSRERPSPDLLETLYSMQRRQGWLRECLIESDAKPLSFAGSARLTDDAASVGREMRRTLGLDGGWAAGVTNGGTLAQARRSGLRDGLRR